MPSTNSNRRRFLSTTGAVAVGALAGCVGSETGTNGTTESDGPTTIRYAGIPKTQLNDLMLLFHQSTHIRENVLEHVGEAYEVEIVTAQGTPMVVSTLGAKEADAGILAYSSLANAIANETISGGGTIVAPLTYDGPRYQDSYAVPSGSDVSSITDLAGKSLAVNAIGSAIDIAARVAFRENDVNTESVDFRELSFGAIPSALKEQKVAAGTFIQPFYQMNRTDLKPVFNTRDAFGSFLKIFITMRNSFLDDHPEAVQAWLDDFWTGIQWWRDDANAEKRLDVAEEVIELPRDLLEQLVQTDQGYYHGEDGLGIDPKWVQQPVDGMHRVGYLDSKIDMSQHIDSSYLPKEANKQPTIE